MPASGSGTAAAAADKVSFEVMVDKSVVRLFYRVPVKSCSTWKNKWKRPPWLIPRPSPSDGWPATYQLTSNQTQVHINDTFRSRSPRLFWLVLLDDERYQGHLNKNTSNSPPRTKSKQNAQQMMYPCPKPVCL